MINTALEIARSTLAKDADNRGAAHTAEQYRSGAWDDSSEIRMAILVATAALESAKIVHDEYRLTLTRAKLFINVLLDEIIRSEY